MSTAWSLLAVSLLGSPHCAAMCGLVAGAAAPTRSAGAWYHLARLSGYLGLGAMVGVLGAGVDTLGSIGGYASLAGLVAGVFLIGVGLLAAAVALGIVRGTAIRTHRWIAALAAGTRRFSPTLRAVTLGLVTALFPCGWLLAFLALAGGAASAADGAQVMGIFWIGTLPALVAASFSARRLAGRFGRRLPLVSAIVVIAMGVVTVIQRAPTSHRNHVAHAR